MTDLQLALYQKKARVRRVNNKHIGTSIRKSDGFSLVELLIAVTIGGPDYGVY